MYLTDPLYEHRRFATKLPDALAMSLDKPTPHSKHITTGANITDLM